MGTDFENESDSNAAGKAGLPQARTLQLPNRHYYFSSSWRPFKPRDGPLRTGKGEEAGLRGRVSDDMCATNLPGPGLDTRVIVSGPPGMWEEVREIMLRLGHSAEALVELKALSTDQNRR